MASYAYMKVHVKGNVRVLAICDEEILGKTFREGKLKIEVKKEFYGDKKVLLDEVFEAIENADIVNMVGENVVNEAIRRGCVLEEGIIRIAGIPHVQIVKL